MPPLTILNIAEPVSEVQYLGYGPQQLYLIAPVVLIGSRRALRSSNLVPQNMVGPGQHSYVKLKILEIIH